jgi:hypothetical protein
MYILLLIGVLLTSCSKGYPQVEVPLELDYDLEGEREDLCVSGRWLDDKFNLSPNTRKSACI